MRSIPNKTLLLNQPRINCNDNTAVSIGFTVHKVIDIGGCSFAALCHPDTDYDDRFKCFDTDNQEWLIVNGWLADDIRDPDENGN